MAADDGGVIDYEVRIGTQVRQRVNDSVAMAMIAANATSDKLNFIAIDGAGNRSKSLTTSGSVGAVADELPTVVIRVIEVMGVADSASAVGARPTVPATSRPPATPGPTSTGPTSTGPIGSVPLPIGPTTGVSTSEVQITIPNTPSTSTPGNGSTTVPAGPETSFPGTSVPQTSTPETTVPDSGTPDVEPGTGVQ
ncbi:MAG: hypothetical protein ACI8Y4_002732 [Candidatus Poriferisodalaceae bacterium]|jgi:hypothetical protein